MPTWKDVVRRITDGTFVNQAVTNQPIDDLVDRTDYLKSVVDAAQFGTALVDNQAVIDEAAVVGSCVYWAGDRYAEALASYTVTSNGVIEPDASAAVVGIVTEKLTDTFGSVALLGQVDFASSIEDKLLPDASSGLYYLSDTVAGAMTTIAPVLAIPVGLYAGNDRMWIAPWYRNGVITLPHIHRVFNLTAAFAGTLQMISPGEYYTVTSVDTDLPGWVPAGTFEGVPVPEGAYFCYNIDKDEDLSAVWPLLSPGTATVLVDGVVVPDGMVVINEHGIWWMAHTYGQGPWTDGYSPNPPDTYAKTVKLALTIPFGDTSDFLVSSLEGVAPVVIKNEEGATAETGKLFVSLADMTITAGNNFSTIAVQSVAADHKTAVTGPTVSAIRSATPQLTVSGTGTTTVGGNVYQTGGITITSEIVGARNGSVDLVALTDVGESSYNGVPYLRFPNGRTSSVRGQLLLPTAGIDANSSLVLTFWLLSPAVSGTSPLELTYRRIPAPSGETSLDQTDTSLTLATPTFSGGSYKYMAAASSAITVQPGDMVLFTLSRSGSNSSFPGDIGLLRASWSIG